METALIVVSDNGHTCNGNNDSGSIMLTYLIDSGYDVLCKIVPDEQTIIEEVLNEYGGNSSVELVLICVNGDADKYLPYLERYLGFVENDVDECKFDGGLCGIRSKTTIIYLPGSSDDVLNCYKRIEPVVLNAVPNLRRTAHSNR